MEMKELWMSIQSFPDYEVSNKGEVRSYKRSYCHLLKPRLRGGYPSVTLLNVSGSSERCIHILVLETFISPRPKGFVANHKDGVKKKNDISNLEWVTKSEDRKHAHLLGLVSFIREGESSPHVKLKGGEVWLIKKLLWFDYPQNKIAKMFKVDRTNISCISRNLTWSHIKFEPTGKDRELYRNKFGGCSNGNDRD